jgi:hypothetical protein
MADQVIEGLIRSINTTLVTKVKLNLKYARKNKQLAGKIIRGVTELLEKRIPKHVETKRTNYAAVNRVHNLCFLLAFQTQKVFNDTIIQPCMDNNWYLQAFSQVLKQLFLECNASGMNIIVGD